MKTICVFCASSNAIDGAYKALAADTGRWVAANGWRMVYGGAKSGMMGAAADGALAAGGKVIGIIPEVLGPQERAHTGLTELIVVPGMHERQKKMTDMADGFIILPGGLGTMAELFEILTWKAIGLHAKNIVLLNHNDFWGPLLEQMKCFETRGFLHVRPEALLRVFHSISDMDGFFED